MNLFIQDLWGGSSQHSSGAVVGWKSKVDVNIRNYIYDQLRVNRELWFAGESWFNLKLYVCKTMIMFDDQTLLYRLTKLHFDLNH